MAHPHFVPLHSRRVHKYIPLQELLDNPRIRILRLLTHHEWLSGHEIAELLGVLWSKQIRNAYATQLSRMRKLGLVVARAPGVWKRGDSFDTFGSFGGPDYRISNAARADLPRIIARATRARR